MPTTALKSIEESNHLLDKLLDYCQHHKLVIYNHPITGRNQINIDFPQHRPPYCSSINHKTLSQQNLLISEDHGNCMVFAGSSNDFSQSPHHANILIEAFWNSSAEIFPHFVLGWCNRPCDLSSVLDYTNNQYERGFFTPSLPKKKSWSSFIKAMPMDVLSMFWNDSEMLERFCSRLEKDTEKAHFILLPLVKKLSDKSSYMFPDTCMHSAKLLMHLFQDQPELQKIYAQYFPLMKSMNERTLKREFFLQESTPIIERMTITFSQVSEYCCVSRLSPSHQEDLTKAILNSFLNQPILHHNGLMNFELIHYTTEVTCYLTLDENVKVNKKVLSQLFASIMNNCLENESIYEHITQKSHNSQFTCRDGILSVENIMALCKKQLEAWHLNNELQNKATIHRRAKV